MPVTTRNSINKGINLRRGLIFEAGIRTPEPKQDLMFHAYRKRGRDRCGRTELPVHRHQVGDQRFRGDDLRSLRTGRSVGSDAGRVLHEDAPLSHGSSAGFIAPSEAACPQPRPPTRSGATVRSLRCVTVRAHLLLPDLRKRRGAIRVETRRRHRVVELCCIWRHLPRQSETRRGKQGEQGEGVENSGTGQDHAADGHMKTWGGFIEDLVLVKR